MSAKKLVGKVAIVTGASKGIGAEIAKQLAAKGASVVVNYASSNVGAEKVVAAVTAQGGKAVAVQPDVAKLDDIRRLFAETKRAFGRLDILVNNAGILQFRAARPNSPEHFHKQFDLNVLGLILTTKEAIPYFGESGGGVGERRLSLVARLASSRHETMLRATKAAVDSITRTLQHRAWPEEDPRQFRESRHGRDRRKHGRSRP